MFRFTFLIFGILIFSNSIKAQNSIKGNIVTSDGIAAANVNITIKDQRKFAVSDAAGNASLLNK